MSLGRKSWEIRITSREFQHLWFWTLVQEQSSAQKDED